jgi:hypothetical protein
MRRFQRYHTSLQLKSSRRCFNLALVNSWMKAKLETIDQEMLLLSKVRPLLLRETNEQTQSTNIISPKCRSAGEARQTRRQRRDLFLQWTVVVPTNYSTCEDSKISSKITREKKEFGIESSSSLLLRVSLVSAGSQK